MGFACTQVENIIDRCHNTDVTLWNFISAKTRPLLNSLPTYTHLSSHIKNDIANLWVFNRCSVTI